MILVDTSVWINHFRQADERLQALLGRRDVVTHPFIIGEVAMGSFRQRLMLLTELLELPRATAASDDEVLGFIGRHGLFNRGLSYIDVHLLAAARLSGAPLWTQDLKLLSAATDLGLAAPSLDMP